MISQPDWSVNPAAFESNGSVTAKIVINASNVSSGILGAFAGEECRGIQETPLFFPPEGHHVFIITCYSNGGGGESLTFKYYNPITEEICNLDQMVEFQPDMIIGNAASPLEMTCSILPTNLNTFQVSNSSPSEILVGWTTSVETNLSHFEIERSFDGLNFKYLGTVEANNNLGQNSYQFIDVSAMEKTNTGQTIYYQLKIIDKNGDVEESWIESIKLFLNSRIRIFPNPLHDWLNIEVQSEKRDVLTIRFISVEGKVVLEKKMEVDVGVNREEVECVNLNSGAYIISIIGEKQSLKQRVFIE